MKDVKIEEGFCVGEACNREGCKGVIEQHDIDGGCSCHVNPPCSYCTTPKEYCPVCDWDALEEQRESELKYPSNYKPIDFNSVNPIYDEKPIYEVIQYFDDIKEGVVKSGLTEKEAYELKHKKANERERYYVSFGVSKMVIKKTFSEWIKSNQTQKLNLPPASFFR